MSNNYYLHGVETKRTITGTPTTKGVNTAILGLIGTANKNDGEIKMVTNADNAVELFGQNTGKYSIPQALESFYKEGDGTVFVINVLNPTTHKTAVTDVSKTFASGKIELTDTDITDLEVKKAGVATVLDTDYEFDGETISVKTGGTLTATDTVTVTYNYLDPTLVTAADIIGGIDEDGSRYGLEMFRNCKTIFGKKPTIFIAPGFTSANVTTAFDTLLADIRGVAYICTPAGTTKDEAVTGRGLEGDINIARSSRHIRYIFPTAEVFNSYKNENVTIPLDAVFAGIRARIDRLKGVHCALSNNKINSIEKLSVPLSFELSDTGCDVNVLNSYGITTVINAGGEFKTWGEENSSAPDNSDIDQFECVCRTADYIEETIEATSLKYVDSPINNGLIDNILLMINSFFKNLIGNGWIIDGKAWYDSAQNPSTQLANGHIKFNYKFLPPAPARQIEYSSFIDIDLYNNLGEN